MTRMKPSVIHLKMTDIRLSLIALLSCVLALLTELTDFDGVEVSKRQRALIVSIAVLLLSIQKQM